MMERSESIQDSPGRLATHFEGHDASTHGNRWQALWEDSYTPWDRGYLNPALLDLLDERKDLVGESWLADPALGKRRKRAIVPGCGRGYDVLLLSAFGYDVYGLEISETALEAAKEHEKLKSDDDEYKARDPSGKGKVTWVSGDFFKDTYLKAIGGDGTFDLLFDYTFLSALPPSLRPAWAARMGQLLSATGILICVEWPTQKDPKSGGPPWALPPEVYSSHLTRPGTELAYSEDGTISGEKLVAEAKDGLQMVEHFHPKRTHLAGIADDGTVTDWVSIWKHKPAN